MILKPHSYQDRATAASIEKKRLYLAIDVGLGKTLISINAVKDDTLPTMVLAPLRVAFQTWPEEIGKWAPGLSYGIMHGAYKNDIYESRRRMYIMNYDGIKWFFNRVTKDKKFPRCNLVLDEASFVKSPKTQRFKMLKKLMPLFPNMRLALSATPAPQGYHELWSQYYLLDGGKALHENYYKFMQSYFLQTGPPTYKTSIKKGADKTIQSRIAPVTFRLEDTDWLDMPELIHNPIYVDLPGELRAQYDQLERDFFIEFMDDEINAINSAVLQNKLRQFVQGCMYTADGNYVKIHDIKIKRLAEVLEGLNGQSILAPIQFKFELAEFKKLLGNNTPIIAGGVSRDEGIRISKAWNACDIPLLLCHPKSVSHGLNLQQGGHNVVWIGMPWSVEQYIQLIGRLRRQGQVSKHVTVSYLLMRNTVDDVVFKTVQQNNATQADLLRALRDYSKEKYSL